jgi:hypothetical protein
MAASPFPERAQQSWHSLRRARHSARLPRYLASAVLLVLLALGIRAAFFAPAAATLAPPPRAAADPPSEDFALQFARAYLSYDAARPGARTRALAPFLGQRLSEGAGLVPSHGSQRVEWAEVASDQRALAGGRLITVAARVSTQRLPLYLAIDVRHDRGAPLELLGYPALVGAPAIAATAPPPSREALSDPAVAEVVDRVLRNYLSGAGPDLKADLSPDAEVTLPTRRLALEEVSELLWLDGPGSGAVLATLSASDRSGTAYTLTYELGIAYRDRPYVDFIEVVPTAS